MDSHRLDNFKRWFNAYTDRYMGDDDLVARRLRGKREHTYRTCKEILRLADALSLDDNQRWIAEVVALFHDVGRFPQFAWYHTYNDARSVDHSRLSVEILGQEGILAVLPREERQWVQTAIEHHGQKFLPADLNGQALLFAKLIRDADKLDIYRVVVDLHRQYQADPDGFEFETDLSNEPEYSPEVLEAVIGQVPVSYDKLRTINDMRLCQIGWVYDMNFAASLARLRHQGYLDELFGFLPRTDEILRLQETIREYIDTRVPVES